MSNISCIAKLKGIFTDARIQYWSGVIQIVLSPLIIISLWISIRQSEQAEIQLGLAIDQSKEAVKQNEMVKEQVRLVNDQTIKVSNIAGVLEQAQIFPLAEKAIGTINDGGDAAAFIILRRMLNQYESDTNAHLLTTGQIEKVSTEHEVLIVRNIIETSSQLSQKDDPSKTGKDISISNLRNLLASDKSWMVRAKAAQLFSEIDDYKFKEIENQGGYERRFNNKAGILTALIERVNHDPSLAVRTIALRSFDKLCKGWETKENYNFDGLSIENCEKTIK